MHPIPVGTKLKVLLSGWGVGHEHRYETVTIVESRQAAYRNHDGWAYRIQEAIGNGAHPDDEWGGWIHGNTFGDEPVIVGHIKSGKIIQPSMWDKYLEK